MSVLFNFWRRIWNEACADVPHSSYSIQIIETDCKEMSFFHIFFLRECLVTRHLSKRYHKRPRSLWKPSPIHLHVHPSPMHAPSLLHALWHPWTEETTYIVQYLLSVPFLYRLFGCNGTLHIRTLEIHIKIKFLELCC